MKKQSAKNVPAKKNANPKKKKLSDSSSPTIDATTTKAASGLSAAKIPAGYAFAIKVRPFGKIEKLRKELGKIKIDADEFEESLFCCVVPKPLRLGPPSVYDQYTPQMFGFYREACDLARSAQKKVPLEYHAPLPLDEDRRPQGGLFLFDPTANYMNCDVGWLKECQKNIQKAIEAGDEKFFVELGRVISERPKYRAKSPLARYTFGLPSDPKPKCETKTFRCILAWNWVTRLLWLMSSPVACDYIQKFTNLKLTPASYNVLKHELGLKQHPKLPVVAMTDDGKIMLRAGWRFPKLESSR